MKSRIYFSTVPRATIWEKSDARRAAVIIRLHALVARVPVWLFAECVTAAAE